MKITGHGAEILTIRDWHGNTVYGYRWIY